MCKVSIRYGDQSVQLREIRTDDPNGHGRHSFTAQQQTLRRLNATFAAFFKRVEAARRARARGEQAPNPGYPRFKPYSGSTWCCSSPGTAPSGSRPTVAGGRTRPSKRSGA
jgi:hypothetical protein